MATEGESFLGVSDRSGTAASQSHSAWPAYNELKEQHVARIRGQSSYPVFRAVINILTIFLYILAGVIALASIYMAGERSDPRLLVGLLVALLQGVFAKVFQEVSLMVADIADSILDLHSRYEQQ